MMVTDIDPKFLKAFEIEQRAARWPSIFKGSIRYKMDRKALTKATANALGTGLGVLTYGKADIATALCMEQ